MKDEKTQRWLVAEGKKGELLGLSVRLEYWKGIWQSALMHECECKEWEVG